MIRRERTAGRPHGDVGKPRLDGVGAIRALEVVDVMDRIREMTGIYGLGFRKESILGLAVPIAFVVLVGGAIAGLILFR